MPRVLKIADKYTDTVIMIEVMETKIVIFDKDGTLLDFDSFWVAITERAIEDMLVQINCPNLTGEEFLSALGVHDGTVDIDGELCGGSYSTMGEVLYRVLKEHGSSIEREELFDIAVRCFSEAMEVGAVVPDCADIRGVLQDLVDAGIKIILVTNDNLSGASLCLQKLGIYDVFDDIYVDDGEHPPKPDPYYADEICKKYGVDRGSVVMVGDTDVDMRFAKNAGIRAVGIAKNERNKSILMQYTDTVIHDISMLRNELK